MRSRPSVPPRSGRSLSFRHAFPLFNARSSSFLLCFPRPLLVPPVLKRSRPGSETWSWGSETPSKAVTTGMVTVVASGRRRQTVHMGRRFEGPYFILRLDLTAARRLPGGDGYNRCTSPPQPLSQVLASEPLSHTRSSRYIWTWAMCGRGPIHLKG
jgi:hypothetical protein